MRSQRNITEDRNWLNTSSSSWVASEHTTNVERVFNRIFRVNVPQANIRNAPDVSGTTIIGTQPSNTRLRITHRRRVRGDMDWFRFDQIIGGINMVGWIADVNGFIEGEIGSPGIMMPPNAEHPQPWIDSRPVSMRNPNYIPGHTSGTHRPFYATRDLREINQIVIHHTASPITLTRTDIEVGWRQLGWWNGGYHEMIRADGTVEVCYNPNVVTNGAYGQNRFSYHISLVGDFRTNGVQPTAPQMNALVRRVRHWQSRLNIPTAQVVGHSERVPTICPGISGNEIRNRVGGNVQTPPSTAADQARKEEMISNMLRRVMNVVGFGEPPGIMNFMPNLVNSIQKRQFMITPKIVGRISFQEVLETSHIDGFNIKDGKIEAFSIDTAIWNYITQLVPGLTLDLFGGRLGELVENGSAVLTIEPEFPHPVPWLTLKIAAENKLPSGNKFKFMLKLQLRPVLRFFDIGDLGLEYIDVPAEILAVEQSIWDQSYGWANHYYEEGALTLLDFLILLGVIILIIASMPARLALASLGIVLDQIFGEIEETFQARDLEVEFYSPI